MPLTVDLGTIAACITGAQRAAVAIVRVSGPQAFSVARQVFQPLADPIVPRHAYYGRFSHGDDGLLIAFEPGHSYTGEATIECNIHGSPASVRALLAACFRAGCRPAEPGEFTRRAFMNGRIDLTQAESVRDTIEALTETQLRAAQRTRDGHLHKQLRHIVDRLYGVLAAVEATTDFAEEIGDLDTDASLAVLTETLQALAALEATADRGRVLRDGFRVAILGKPNAGKSSLLNALLGIDRAIVTPTAGTTRDTVEELVELGSVPVRLVDTAGLRDSDDEVERLGIERSRREAEAADLVIDLKAADDRGEWMHGAKDARVLRVISKADLLKHPAVELATSAVTGTGIAELTEEIVRRANLQEVEAEIFIQARHVPYLTQAMASTHTAIETLERDLPTDLVSTCLRDAIHQIGIVTGETSTVDMVDRIFADFCIGK